ncbi:hypothetical protein [Corynebacterium caspium]|uniref:hypothetical protein n=1 Tax=Corynebacterium caspium TaxID=234828 RepID=UPI00035CCC6A|nr:hypothetical protein [Corynebacterium caspium]WKD58652.1 hypothetical protein CCASP_01130 [Corynebacterium caspium DSM 44850]
MHLLFLCCGDQARTILTSAALPEDAQIITLPTLPQRSDLRVLDEAARVALPVDPTPSLEDITAQPDVRHLGAPTTAPQVPYLKQRLRVIVVGDDAALSAVLTRLMRADNLWVEVAYLPLTASAAAKNWGLPIGAAGLPLALYGQVNPAPLIRNDRGVALAGSATITDFDAAPMIGEVAVDSHTLLFSDAYGVRLVPLHDAPGIAAVRLLDAQGSTRKFLQPAQIKTGRAVQAGGQNLKIVVDGVAVPRPVERTTFYRHLRDLQIVRP